MHGPKRMIYYLLINVFVSACTILTVLFLWDRLRSPLPVALFDNSSASPTAEAAEPAAGTPAGRTTITYVVQAGDTLLDIALEFGVPLETLIEFNGLDNPNQLSVGDELLIPIDPASLPSPTPSPTPTVRVTPPTPIPISATPAPSGKVVLSIQSVVAPGDIAEERVIVQQTGSGQAAMQGWKLEDQDGNVFIFPQLTLFQDGAVSVYTRLGVNTVVELYWGLSVSIWEPGEVVSLIDPSGAIVAAFQIP